MSALKSFVEKMLGKYGDAVETVPAKGGVDLQQVPAPLVEFYSLYDRISFPFGRIEPPDASVESSAVEEPFKSGRAFCFGGDTDGFRFWLCAVDGPDEDGCVFTSWDHDLDDEIEYAFRDLADFLRYAENEYLESMSANDQ